MHHKVVILPPASPYLGPRLVLGHSLEATETSPVTLQIFDGKSIAEVGMTHSELNLFIEKLTEVQNILLTS